MSRVSQTLAQAIEEDHDEEAFDRHWSTSVDARLFLMRTIERGEIEEMERFLGTPTGKSVLHSSHRGEESPLGYACHIGSRDAVEVLVRHGADIHTHDGQGMTPLAHAVSGHRQLVMRYLLSLGADPNLRSLAPEAETPLHIAAARGHVDSIRVLMEAGARNEITNAAGLMPDQVADMAKHESAARFIADYDHAVCRELMSRNDIVGMRRHLARRRIDPRTKNARGVTPLEQAVSLSTPSMVRLLLSHGADVDCGLTSPLIISTYGDRPVIMRVLLEAGADINAEDKGPDHGRLTALHHAASAEALQTLLEFNPDTSFVNELGKTVLDQWQQSGPENLARLMKDYVFMPTILSRPEAPGE